MHDSADHWHLKIVELTKKALAKCPGKMPLCHQCVRNVYRNELYSYNSCDNQLVNKSQN